MSARNPFRMLRAEQIKTDLEFIRMFGVPALKILLEGDESIWGRIVVIKGNPGSGKTTLLRVFVPSILWSLFHSREDARYRELYNTLNEDFQVYSETRPTLLGVHVRVPLGLTQVETLPLAQHDKTSLLLVLLDTRIGLAVLQHLAALARVQYPDGLSEIRVDLKESYYGLVGEHSALEIFGALARKENSCLRVVDSFEPVWNRESAVDTLPSFQLLEPCTVTMNGHRVFDRSILMVDNFQLLQGQPAQLVLELMMSESGRCLWLSTRSESSNIVSSLLGRMATRDYIWVDIEEFWLQRNKREFRHMLEMVAEKRIRASKYGALVSSFNSCVQEKFTRDTREKIEEAIQTLKERVSERARAMNFQLVPPADGDNADSELLMLAKDWRGLEVLMARERSGQSILDDKGVVKHLSCEMLDSRIRDVAHLFLAKEFGIPYYYGNKIYDLSSYNVEQFLLVAGDIFQQVTGRIITRKEPFWVSPEQQQKIVKRKCNEIWESIPRLVANGREIQRLLDLIFLRAADETYREGSPYCGVTGVGFRTRPEPRTRDLFQQVLVDHNRLNVHSIVPPMAAPEEWQHLLEASVASGLLLAKQVQQGNRSWVVLYLNRLLCVRYKLPLSYGGWRPYCSLTRHRKRSWPVARK